MGLSSAAVWFVAGYSLALVVIAWIFDYSAQRVSTRSSRWRNGEFVYLEDHDAWKCKEDQWLWPMSFDPENRVMLYKAHPIVCNNCHFKDGCTTSETGREIRREVDPWPHSEAGRFHRGIALAIAVLGVAMPVLAMIPLHSGMDIAVLAAVAMVAIASSIPLARHLWSNPANFPVGVVEKTRQETAVEVADRFASKYASKWGFGSDEAAEGADGADGVAPSRRTKQKETL